MAAYSKKENNIIYHWGIITGVICVTLSIYSYIADCVINFPYAIKNINYLGAYLLNYLIFKSWVFIIIIPVYYWLFKGTARGGAYILKVAFVITLALLVSRWLYKDDFSLIIGATKHVKLYIIYCLAFLTAMTVYEYKYKSRII